MLPIIGITSDCHEKRHRIAAAYSTAVRLGGGIPIILPPVIGMESHYLTICDGFIFSGGDDPNMEEWGIQTSQKAIPVSSQRQQFELSLLRILQQYPEIPVLGVCLGMQWMGLIAGGTIEQDLPQPLASTHLNADHPISGIIGNGVVHSHHHQAMIEVASMEIIGTSQDGVIEAIRDSQRSWYVGVQWHPERTEDFRLGQDIFNQLIKASMKLQETT